MTAQLAIDYEAFTHARAGGPATSADAAVRAQSFALTHAELVSSALRGHPGGLTAHEVASITRLDYVQVCRRFTDLERAGRAVRTDRTRGTPSGGRATVWAAT